VSFVVIFEVHGGGTFAD